VGFFPGSFDPITLGHLHCIRMACRIVDKLVVGVHYEKCESTLFSKDDRLQLVRDEVAHMVKEDEALQKTEFDFYLYDSMTVQMAMQEGASVIFRGVRDTADVVGEIRMASMNDTLSDGKIITILLPGDKQTCHISSTLVRQIANSYGDPSPFLGPVVSQFLREC
jgi:pantetheine-phosphate adenylyltransferase